MANKKKNSTPNGVKFLINAQYLKDISFENPKAPDSLRKFGSNPKIQIDIDVKSRPLKGHGENIFEVELIIKGETNVDNESIFLIEASYCGVFTIEHAKGELLEKILLIECPKFLFPFLRSVLSNCTREGGFPPLMVAPVDFSAMYEKRKSKK